MDTLPLEIVSQVAYHLQKWTISDHPFAHLTETSIYGTDGWLTHTSEAREDICNFRLACRRTYGSSFSTFGSLLGSRIFRITKVGLQDLLAISRVQALGPHIQTLTFGNARFGNANGIPLLQEIFHSLSQSNRSRLQAAYMDAYHWAAEKNVKTHIRLLASALQGLHNVKNLRLLVSDHPSMYCHLGGWLGPGDDKIIAKAGLEVSDIWLSEDGIYEVNIGNGAVFNPLLIAIQATDTEIVDLRVGHGYALAPNNLPAILHVTGAPSRLRYLRKEIDPRYLCFNPHAAPSGAYWDAFNLLTNVSHLSLSMTRDAAFNDFATATTNLLRILTPMPLLQQVTIRGVWTYSEQELVDFVASRRDHLTQFALMGPVLLDGTWSSLLRKLMLSLTNRTKHLQFTNMSKRESNTRIIPALDHKGWQNFMREVKVSVENAGYTVCLSSDHRKYTHHPH